MVVMMMPVTPVTAVVPPAFAVHHIAFAHRRGLGARGPRARRCVWVERKAVAAAALATAPMALVPVMMACVMMVPCKGMRRNEKL